MGPEMARLLAKCHDRRNLAEYEGILEVDERLLADLQAAGQDLLEAFADSVRYQRVGPRHDPGDRQRRIESHGFRLRETAAKRRFDRS